MVDSTVGSPPESNETFERAFAALLAAMRAERRLCPASEHLLALADGRLGAEEREHLVVHVGVCSDCSELLERARALPGAVDDLTWQRAARGLDQRDRPWLGAAAASSAGPERGSARRAWLVAAAVVAAIGAGAGFWLTRPPSPPVSEVRGAALHAITPAGRIDALEAFEWSSVVPGALPFRVEVEVDGRNVWRGDAAPGATELPAPPELTSRLAAGGSARWRVVGLSSSGTVVAESGWTPFELGGSTPPG
jgi:hypothetical protein